MQKFKKIIIFSLLILFLFLGNFCFAQKQTNNQLPKELSAKSQLTNELQPNNLLSYDPQPKTERIINIIFGFLGILAVLSILVSPIILLIGVLLYIQEKNKLSIGQKPKLNKTLLIGIIMLGGGIVLLILIFILWGIIMFAIKQ